MTTLSHSLCDFKWHDNLNKSHKMWVVAGAEWTISYGCEGYGHQEEVAQY